MEENSVTTKQIALKYGLISGLIGIVYFVIINLIDQGMNQSLSSVGFLILAVIIYLAHKAFKDEGDSHMSYGQGLGVGTLLSLVSSTIIGIFTFIYVSYINPEYIQQVLDLKRGDMEDQGLGDAQSMAIEKMVSSPVIMSIMGILTTVFVGFIISLIVSAITQNKRPENDLI